MTDSPETSAELKKMAASITSEILSRLAEGARRIDVTTMRSTGWDCTGTEFTCGKYQCTGTVGCSGKFGSTIEFTG